ncbi:MAG: metal-dependent transcriptional regulator [Deltaproteobacteria bacterium]|nr:metal-dependent transcriptional regulator [Deltaproteobacteria bacterium]
MEIDELSESLQSYLDVILELEGLQKVARAKDIADRLKIQRGSVTAALKSLEEKGLIHYQPYSFITLTDSGKKVAEEIAHRHRVLKAFLLNVLQIDEPTAETTACRMEHVIDRTTVDRLVCFIEYIHTCPRAGEDWLESFIRFCKSDQKHRGECTACIRGLKPLGKGQKTGKPR